MANELNIVLADSGLTVTCQRYLNGAAVSPAIALTEVSAGSGVYSGNMAGAAGNYALAFRAGGANVGAGSILWDGTKELTLEPLAAIKAKTDALNTDRLAVCSTVEITGQQLTATGIGLIVGDSTIAFSPTSVAGLQLWLDASDATTLFDASSGGAVVTADGGAVARWMDKSGFNDAIQVTASKKPVLKLGVQNSKNTLFFDGIDDCLQVPSVSLNANITFFVVGKFFDLNPFWLEQPYGFLLTTAGTGWYYRRQTSVLSSTLPDVWFSTNAGIISASLNGMQTVVRKNGVPVSNTNLQGDVPQNLALTAGLDICSRNQTMNFTKGNLCEILIYDGILSDQSRAQIESYLSAKWGIVI